MTNFQLDKKELTQELPMFVKPLANAFIDWLNKLDANHDGKSDLAELAPYVIKALPFITALAPLIDWEKFVEWILSHDFITDKDAARKATTELLTLLKSIK